MLLNFTVKNWSSIADEVTFSMEPSEDTQDEDGKITTVDSVERDILNTAAVYGGNASGKSNFIAAIHYVKQMVLGENSNYTPFLLDPDYKNEETSFAIEFLAGNDRAYRLEFSVRNGFVTEEKLCDITKFGGTKRVVYDRSRGTYNRRIKQLDVVWDIVVNDKSSLILSKFLKYYKIPYFQPVGDWFSESLLIILPGGADMSAYPDYFSDVIPNINGLLHQLDLGVSRIGTQDLSKTNPSRSNISSSLMREIERKKHVLYGNNSTHTAFQFSMGEDGNLKIDQLTAVYTNSKGEDVLMPLEFESDGTWRIITLAPAFAELMREKSRLVLIVDEFDRSLHTLLTRALIENFQNCRPKTARSQLIFTSHDVMLMDTSLLLVDSLWIIEKRDNKTELIPLSDYTDLNQLKIREDYLEGRLGGIPSILVAPFVQGEAENFVPGKAEKK